MAAVLVSAAGVAHRMTAVPDLVRQAATRWPDASAVRDASGRWTYAQLLAESQRFAAWLATRGVAPGDRVAVQMTGTRQAVAAVHGCGLVGAVAVPLNPKMKPFQLRQVLADAAPAVMVGEDVPLLSAAGHLAWAPAAGWPDLPAALPDPPDVREPVGPAYLLYTSGSMAAPKAVIAPHAAVLFAADAIQRALSYRHTDVVFCRVPLSFDYGLYQTLLCALAGAELVLADPGRDAALLADIRATGATIVPVVPSIATMLTTLARRDPAPTAVRLFTNTGEAMPAVVLAELRRRFPDAGWHLMFGVTECKRVTIMERDGDLARPGSVGRPLEGTAVRIADTAGRSVSPGVSGEIVVRGPHVMAGYWNAPELTARTFCGGELYTGDVGHLDEDGYLYFAGRRDTIFKQNGVRTSVAEIEAAVRDVPGVRDAVVVPPADGRGAVLCAVTSGSAAEVLRALHDRLDSARVPAACLAFATFPLTQTGKLDRQAIARIVEERGNA
jgi:acyl-CoA synthetase (AMP-forming)/AMP-acid ligase II